MFGLHPSRPESVSWISGSTDLWMALLVLLGLWAWDRWNDRRGTVIASAAFGLALFAKEAAVPVPLLLVLDAWLLSEVPEERRPRLRRAAIVCAVVGVLFVLRVAVAPLAIGGSVDEGLLQSVLRVGASLGHYVRLLLWPWAPSIVPACQQFDDAGLPMYQPWAWSLGLVAVAGVVAFALAAWRRPRLRPWLADLAWFVVLLVPVLNLVAIRTSTLVAARFLYLPLLGASALLARAGVVVALVLCFLNLLVFLPGLRGGVTASLPAW